MAITRTELDVARCETPGCDHTGHSPELYIHSICHPNSPVELSYDRTTGELTVNCAKCGGMVAEIAVAEEDATSTPYPRPEKPQAVSEKDRVISEVGNLSDTFLSMLTTVDEPTGMTTLAIATCWYLYKISETRKAYREVIPAYIAELRRACTSALNQWEAEYRKQGGKR